LPRWFLRGLTHGIQQIIWQVGRKGLRLVHDFLRLTCEEVAPHEGIETGTGCRKDDPTRRSRASVSVPGRVVAGCSIGHIRKSFRVIDDRF
jgi:hypothetical protein